MLNDSIVRHNILRIDEDKGDKRIVCNCGWMSDIRLSEEDARKSHENHVLIVAEQLGLDENDTKELKERR